MAEELTMVDTYRVLTVIMRVHTNFMSPKNVAIKKTL